MYTAIEKILGPMFLLVYSGYLVALFIVLKMKAKDKLPLSKFGAQVPIDALEYAILEPNGLQRKCIDILFISLWDKGALKQDDTHLISISPEQPSKTLNAIELEVLSLFDTPLSYNQFQYKAKNHKPLLVYLNDVKKSLIAKKLMKSDEEMAAEIRRFRIFMVVALFPGVLKLIMGVSNGRPVVFLFLLLILFVIVALAQKPKPITLAGEESVKAKRNEIESAKEHHRLHPEEDLNLDPAMAMSVGGMGMLSMFAATAAMNEMMYTPGRDSGSSGSDGSYSSGCSSSDSGSDSGSSDSGSSDGGSGCGGCGGCGGGD